MKLSGTPTVMAVGKPVPAVIEPEGALSTTAAPLPAFAVPSVLPPRAAIPMSLTKIVPEEEISRGHGPDEDVAAGRE